MRAGLVLAGLLLAQVALAATTAATNASDGTIWSVWGGEVGVHWNRDLATDIGLRIGAPSGHLADAPDHHYDRLAVRRSGALEFVLDRNRFGGFRSGSLQAVGGYVIDLPGARIDLTGFRLVARAGNPFQLDVVSADGKAWFYVDRLMYDNAGPDRVLAIRTMDVRISAALAARLGQPMVAGWVIADMELASDVLRRGSAAAPTGGGSCNANNGAGCNFSDVTAPDGDKYKADLFMKSFVPQYSRCQGCSGPAGSGTIVFTPSSTLKNNVNAGSIAATIPGDPLGTSSALWAADIPWYEKFSGNYPPYGNDQHPYLIWNMYRIDADGRIEQIGRSGVKHAFLTVNSGADCQLPFGHVLGVTCEDTYGVGNNDSSSDLGPRSEIIPATNQWGRCGSIYDVDCNGSNDNPSYSGYDYRLKVGESQIAAAANPGASWMFESWYLARQDINIYNSMGTVTTTQNWSGSVWGISAASYQLGPAIDRWVNPTAPPANAMNSELAVTEGHARVAVKVIDNGDGTWRYIYAVMNLDFSRAETDGAEPNLRVLSNRGFDSFSVPLPAGAGVDAASFSDGDLDAGNDWTLDTNGGRATWTAVASGPTLDWGTLYTFTLTIAAAPGAGTSNLHVARDGAPAAFDVDTLVPAPADTIFMDGFDATP